MFNSLTISLALALLISLLISLPRCLPLSLSLYLSLSLSLSDLFVGGVDICAMLQQRLHHVEFPVDARPHKSRRALDETRKEKNAH